ncbi:MAG: hypothetical protein OS112_02890 [Methanoregula sp.]|nr:MAG: hypothetical protein OS112_02890 [Methanoregula sp.]
MRTKTFICGVLIAAFALCCIMAPVTAVILEVTCKGEVSTVNTAKNTLTIKNPVQYGCEYPAGKDPVCSWTPMARSSLTGTVPDAAAFSVFKVGDTAVATSIGGAGDQWITLAKLYGSRPNEEFVTELIGDPRTVNTPFIGDYAIVAETVPDCTACTGTVCTASQAELAVKSSGTTVAEKTLKPGESLVYNGRNDGSSVNVKFIAGQAAAQICPGKAGMTGPQAVSTYVIGIVPPIGTGQVNIRTATTTRPDEALTPLPPSAAGTTVPAPTKSGVPFPAAVIGALALISVIWTRARS